MPAKTPNKKERTQPSFFSMAGFDLLLACFKGAGTAGDGLMIDFNRSLSLREGKLGMGDARCTHIGKKSSQKIILAVVINQDSPHG